MPSPIDSTRQELVPGPGQGKTYVVTENPPSIENNNNAITQLPGQNPKKHLEQTFSYSSFSGADIRLLIHSSRREVVDAKVLQLTGQINELEAKIAENRENTFFNNSPSVASETDAFEEQVESLRSEIERLLESGRVTIPLATVQSLSLQVFREKYAVRSLGYNSPKAFTRGPRSIAGSMIFSVFDEHALTPFLHYPPTMFAHEKASTPSRIAFIDQLPPMTISIEFANEYGSISEMTIYGVEFIDDGQVISIQDIFTENTCSFVARDYDPLVSRGTHPSMEKVVLNKSASSLMNDPEYRNMSKRFGWKRNPYI